MKTKILAKAAAVVLGFMFITAGAVQTASAQLVAAPDAGSFEQGRTLGLENGAIMVQRVRNQTIDRYGCSQLPRFQSALMRLVRQVRPTRDNGDQFVRGYFRGYSSAIRQGLREARAQCGLAVFYDGEYPGRFGGELFCQLLDTGADLLADYEFEPIYDGWTTEEDVKSSCKMAFAAVTSACGAGEVSELASLAKQAACI